MSGIVKRAFHSRKISIGSGAAVREPGEIAGPAGELGRSDRELLILMTEGLTNRELAERLGVGESEITTRLASIMATIGASDRAQATTLAMRGLGAALPVGAGQGIAWE